MNWENCDFESEDVVQATNNPNSKLIHDENEQKRLTQLSKLQDPRKDERRQFYIAAATRFGELLVNGNQKEIAKTLLSEDCEAFLFNFGEITPVKYGTKPQEFTQLYKDGHIIRRDVKEVFVDSECSIAFQICFCQILKEEDGSIMSQFSFEAFSFKGDKICKYRSSFGCSMTTDEFRHPFELTRKEKMVAKVKELNYAWAGEPDLERIASLFHESTEYKIWRWDDQKAFTFYKNNLAANFRSLEENYIIKNVVPYEVYSEEQFIISTYVYHLQGKNELSGQNFMWLSTCIYAFDRDLNITKINQQGELCLEDEMLIPFEVYSREKLIQDAKDSFSTIFRQALQNESILSTDEIMYSFEAYSFGPRNLPRLDVVRGFNDYSKLRNAWKENSYLCESADIVDIYIDNHDPSYDVIIKFECVKARTNKEGYKYSGIDMNFYSMKKMSIEKGRIAKVVAFCSEVPEVILSPYDNPLFSAQNIKCKGENNI